MKQKPKSCSAIQSQPSIQQSPKFWQKWFEQKQMFYQSEEDEQNDLENFKQQYLEQQIEPLAFVKTNYIENEEQFNILEKSKRNIELKVKQKIIQNTLSPENKTKMLTYIETGLQQQFATWFNSLKDEQSQQ